MDNKYYSDDKLVQLQVLKCFLTLWRGMSWKTAPLLAWNDHFSVLTEYAQYFLHNCNYIISGIIL